MIKYIKTKSLSHKTKKSWWAIVNKAMKETNKGDWGMGFYQYGSDWESYDYNLLLQRLRSIYRPYHRLDPFPNIGKHRWEFKHHCDLLKRGIRKPTGKVQDFGQLMGKEYK